VREEVAYLGSSEQQCLSCELVSEKSPEK